MRNTKWPSLARATSSLFSSKRPQGRNLLLFVLLFQSGSFSDLPMSIRCRTWPKVHHIVRTPLAFVPRNFGCVASSNQTNIRDLLEANLSFFYAITSLFSSRTPRFYLQSITARLALLRSYSSSLCTSLTPFLSSSKQTDFRNVASSRPHLGRGLIYAPTRRRRRRHLSYMRRCLHMQQQNRPSDPCSLRIQLQQSSDPHPSTSVVSFAICSCIPYRLGAVENKTHHPCHSSLTESSPYLRRSRSSLQKAKQMHRCIQSSQAPCPSPKVQRSLNCSPCCDFKSEGQQGPQAHILGQRHDRRVFK